MKSNNHKEQWMSEALACADVGVWRGNFTKRYYELENFRKLGLKSGILPFDEYIKYVRADYRDFVTSDQFSMMLSGEYERTYPIVMSGEEIWIYAKSFRKEVNEDGDVIIWGIFKRVTVQSEIDEAQIKRDLLNVIHKHNNIASILVSFLNSRDLKKNVNNMTREILSFLQVGRCSIFEYDTPKGTQSCVFEQVEDGVKPEISNWQNVAVNHLSWWNRKIFINSPIILKDVNTMGEGAKDEQSVFLSRGVKSVMAVPLPGSNGVWGYLMVETFEKKRDWSNLDYQWLSATANMLSVCLELYRHENVTKNTLSQQQATDLLMMQIFDNSPVGLQIFDDNGLMVRGNRECARIYGIENLNDVIGHSLYETPFITEDVKEKLHNHEDVHIRVDFTGMTVSGFFESNVTTNKDLAIHLTPISSPDGLFSNYLMLTVDNTRIYDVESKLSEMENVFSVVSDYSKIGYAKVSLSKGVTYASRQWFKNWGEDEDTPVSDVLFKYNHVHPDDKKSLIEFEDNIGKGKVSNVFESVLRVDNGEGGWKWIQVTIVHVSNSQRGENDLISVTIDVTTEKESEIALMDAKSKAETMDRLKSAFLANMSHEIRTPLNAIIGFSGLLTSPDFASADVEDRKYYGSIIKENSDLLLQLISDILDLSKIEAGTLDFFYSAVDINVLFRDLYNVQSRKTKEGVELKIDTPMEECVIRSDKNRLMQLLINFLTNAIKFTSSGSITLGYRMVKGEKIEFYVQDTGMGISPAEQKLVFDSFVKLNNSIKGTGLGLAICKSIVEQMGGEIGVSSVKGEGSCFWFRLPYVQATTENAVEEISKADEHRPADGKKPSVLIAEDNESSYILLATALKKQYDVVWAQNGAIAVAMYKENKPDLIIMDIRMPEMDGLEATRTIRKTDKSIPIICLTAFAFSSDREAAVNAGCNDFLTKPVSTIVMKEMIHKLLKNY